MKKIEFTFKWINTNFPLKNCVITIMGDEENLFQEINSIINEVNKDILKIRIIDIKEVEYINYTAILKINELQSWLETNWLNTLR
jgi:hypothetical protein